MTTIARIKSIAARILPVRAMAARQLKDRAMVLTLHRVNAVNAGDGLTIGPEDFEDYCRFLSRHFNVVPLAEIVQRLETGAPLDRRVAITFDDGYRDNFEVAAPILRRHGLHATFFVTTGFIGTDRIAPWDEHMSATPGWMTWNQVRGLRDQGFAIGGHTADHVDLGEVSAAIAMKQLTESRSLLNEQLGEEVDLFAYPFGRRENITEENRLRVREAGFSCCVSCFGGFVYPGTDPFVIQRIAITSWYSSPDNFAYDMAFRRF